MDIKQALDPLTHPEIVEGNDLLARFTGIYWNGFFEFSFWEDRRFESNQLLFHSSWDWLLKVVDTLKQRNLLSERHRVTVCHYVLSDNIEGAFKYLVGVVKKINKF
jgi:hypothetical protein